MVAGVWPSSDHRKSAVDSKIFAPQNLLRSFSLLKANTFHFLIYCGEEDEKKARFHSRVPIFLAFSHKISIYFRSNFHFDRS